MTTWPGNRELAKNCTPTGDTTTSITKMGSLPLLQAFSSRQTMEATASITPAISKSSTCNNNYHTHTTLSKREVTMLLTDLEIPTTQFSLVAKLCSKVSIRTPWTSFHRLPRMPTLQSPRCKLPRIEPGQPSTAVASRITSTNTWLRCRPKRSSQDKDSTRTSSSTAKGVFTKP